MRPTDPRDPRSYRALPKGITRDLVFNLVDDQTIKILKNLGYRVICLLEMPRGSPSEELQYLKFKARGIEEGTVEATQNQLDMLKLQFKAAGLLDENRGASKDAKPREDDANLIELLREFKPSRHTTDQSSIDLVKGGTDV